MKNLIAILIVFLSFNLVAQDMKWVPSDIAGGGCELLTDCALSTVCYNLQYTPGNSGILTSYTTGYIATCNNGTINVTHNMSCVINDKSREIYACEQNTLLINSSGNTGQLKVEKDHPIYLHQVCFEVSDFQGIEMKEDPVTGLTVSLDIQNGEYETDKARLVKSTVRNGQFPCKILGAINLDLEKSDITTLDLEWNSVKSLDEGEYHISRSYKGGAFVEIAKVPSSEVKADYGVYTDADLRSGEYQYKVTYIVDGEEIESNITSESIELDAGLKIYPNPASNLVNIIFNDGGEQAQLKIFDVENRLVFNGKIDPSRINKMQLNEFIPGTYIISVKGDFETLQDKFIIIK